LLLAMAAAGLDDGRLYAGSWSEWIREPARPIATGAEP
jgi:thiosulfate/3-mercaptopyruvate sulfurtransferase